MQTKLIPLGVSIKSLNSDSQRAPRAICSDSNAGIANEKRLHDKEEPWSVMVDSEAKKFIRKLEGTK